MKKAWTDLNSSAHSSTKLKVFTIIINKFSHLYANIVLASVFGAYLRVIAHDVVKSSQKTQAGTDLHMHGSIHIVEEVQGLVDELTAFF